MRRKIIICGGGIIGCSTAYYLTELGETDVTVIERCDIACHASGKAGGFFSLDWNDDNNIGPLARKSFHLYETLAAKIGEECGYRKVESLSVIVRSDPEHRPTKRSRNSEIPSWLDGNVVYSSSIGSTETTAQITPAVLTNGLMSLAQMKGAKVLKGRVEDVLFQDDNETVAGVIVDGDKIEADVVVIALGPWSKMATKWFPKSQLPEITAFRCHSITMKAETVARTGHCVFLTYVDEYHRRNAPMIYPRPNGDVYVCGCSDAAPLPDDPSTITPNISSTNRLHQIAMDISSDLKSAPLEKAQACFLPVSPDDMPLIGKIPLYNGAYIAAGHSCYGFVSGPATGLGLAECIAEGTAEQVDLKPFDPARFRT